MRTRFAFAAVFTALTQVWACGEFVSDAPDDANLSPRKSTGDSDNPKGSDAAPPDASPDLEFASCLDPKVAGATFCEDFTGGAKSPMWTLRQPAGKSLVLIKHDAPDLWIQGTHAGGKEFYLHDFAERDTSFEAQLNLKVNSAVEGNAQVFAFYFDSMRSLGFSISGTALSVFRYDDDDAGTKALVPLLPDARGSHTIRLVATAGTTWKFQASVDNGALRDVPSPFSDLTPKLRASIAVGFLGGSSTGMVDYSIDNILVR